MTPPNVNGTDDTGWSRAYVRDTESRIRRNDVDRPIFLGRNPISISVEVDSCCHEHDGCSWGALARNRVRNLTTAVKYTMLGFMLGNNLDTSKDIDLSDYSIMFNSFGSSGGSANKVKKSYNAREFNIDMSSAGYYEPSASSDKTKKPATTVDDDDAAAAAAAGGKKNPGTVVDGGTPAVSGFSDLSAANQKAAKKAGNILLNAVNDKNSNAGGSADGDQVYSGIFRHASKRNNEDGATLKENDVNRGQWHRGSVTTASDQDYKNAVKIGNAQGENTDVDAQTGAPRYFTMTDYRSGNQYTFKLFGYDTDTGQLQYKLDINGSDLTKDGAATSTDGVNGKNWEFASGAADLIFNVNVNTSSHEIELTYSNGDKVSLDKLAH